MNKSSRPDAGVPGYEESLKTAKEEWQGGDQPEEPAAERMSQVAPHQAQEYEPGKTQQRAIEERPQAAPEEAGFVIVSAPAAFEQEAAGVPEQLPSDWPEISPASKYYLMPTQGHRDPHVSSSDMI